MSTSVEAQQRRSAKQLTPDQRAIIRGRREKAAELYSLGHSYADVGDTLGVSHTTAREDVLWYFKNAATYYRAAEYRERLAVTYQATIRMARREFQKLPDKPEYSEARMRCLDRVHKACEGLSRLYGFVGENTFRLELPITPAEAANPDRSQLATEWAKEMAQRDPNRMRALKDSMLHTFSLMPREAVPAAYRTEQPPEAVVVEEAQNGNPPTQEPETEPPTEPNGTTMEGT